MEPVRLWAAVEFTAQSGSTDALLGHAAQAGLHLTRIVPLPGGFRARCAAWHYRPLAALARQGHVRLRVKKRLGLFFWLRPLLRRTGLWAGLALFIPLLLWSQQFVWAVDTSTLTRGQAARAFAVLRQADLAPGAAATEAKRTAGEYALLESGEFSWASLNFEKGRLAVEAAPARARPEIAAGTLHGLRAKCNGTVLRTNLASGTMLVAPGQTVEAGQGLIGTARSERDGTLIFAPAAGTVVAQLEWETGQSVPLAETISQLTGQNKTNVFRGALCRAFALRTRWRWAVPHPASAIRGFRSATALRGGGDHLLRAAARDDLPHRGAGAYAGAAARAAGTARCFPGCRHPRPPGGMYRAGVYTALQCRVYCGGRYLHIVKGGRFGMVSALL